MRRVTRGQENVRIVLAEGAETSQGRRCWAGPLMMRGAPGCRLRGVGSGGLALGRGAGTQAGEKAPHMLPQATGGDHPAEELQKKSSKATFFWSLWGRGGAGRGRREAGGLFHGLFFSDSITTRQPQP